MLTNTVLSDTGYGEKDAVRILIREQRVGRVGSRESILIEVCLEDIPDFWQPFHGDFLLWRARLIVNQ